MSAWPVLKPLIQPFKAIHYRLLRASLINLMRSGEFREELGSILRDDGVRDNLTTMLSDDGVRKAMADAIGAVLWEPSLRASIASWLTDTDNRKATWVAASSRPKGMDCSYYWPHNISDMLFEMACRDSADYIVRNMPMAKPFESNLEHLRYHIGRLPHDDGLILEFGVFQGGTVNLIAEMLPHKTVHGFDSFEGLPGDWPFDGSKGAYSTGGALPNVRDNVRLHVGWFDKTLSGFLAENPGHVSMLHIDCDMYESTKAVLDLLEGRIVKDTVIVFDEYLNYPNFRDHEMKAFHEFIGKTGLGYKYLSYVGSGNAVAVRVL